MKKTFRNITLGISGFVLAASLTTHVASATSNTRLDYGVQEPSVLGLNFDDLSTDPAPIPFGAPIGISPIIIDPGDGDITPITPVDPPATNEDQGVSGTVMYGPISPVCRDDTPCYLPYSGTIVVNDLDGNQVTSFTPDENGNFSVSLPTGDYTFSTLELTTLKLTPQSASVSDGSYTHLDFLLDTGIR